MPNKIIKVLNLDDFEYKFNQDEKNFIYVFEKNNSLEKTSKQLNMPLENCTRVYSDPKVQEAIKFLRLQKHREIFNTKMMTLEDIGKYLSNAILDLSGEIPFRDKLDATNLLINVHKTMNDIQKDPIEINSYNILSTQVQNLTVNDIKNLLYERPQENVDESTFVNEIKNLEVIDKVNKKHIVDEKAKRSKSYEKAKEKLKVKS